MPVAPDPEHDPADETYVYPVRLYARSLRPRCSATIPAGADVFHVFGYATVKLHPCYFSGQKYEHLE